MALNWYMKGFIFMDDELDECIEVYKYSELKWDKSLKHAEDFLLSYFGKKNSTVKSLLSHLKKDINHTESISVTTYIPKSNNFSKNNRVENLENCTDYFLDIYRFPDMGILFVPVRQEFPKHKKIDERLIATERSFSIKFPYFHNRNFGNSFTTITNNIKNVKTTIIEPLEPIIVDLFNSEKVNAINSLEKMLKDVNQPLHVNVMSGIYGNREFFVIDNMSINVYNRNDETNRSFLFCPFGILEVPISFVSDDNKTIIEKLCEVFEIKYDKKDNSEILEKLSENVLSSKKITNFER